VRETKQGQFFKHPCENIKTGKPKAQAAYYCKVGSSEAKTKRTKLTKCSHIHNEMKQHIQAGVLKLTSSHVWARFQHNAKQCTRALCCVLSPEPTTVLKYQRNLKPVPDTSDNLQQSVNAA